MKLIKIFLTVLVLTLTVAAGGTAYYFYTKYQTARTALDNPEALAQNEVKQLTDLLSKLIILPEGEEPTVATVLDKDKLKDQPFFAKAENGDKVVIFTKAAKAILYRPSANKIIEVTPISMETEKPKQEPEPEPSVEPSPSPAAAE